MQSINDVIIIDDMCCPETSLQMSCFAAIGVGRAAGSTRVVTSWRQVSICASSWELCLQKAARSAELFTHCFRQLDSMALLHTAWHVNMREGNDGYWWLSLKATSPETPLTRFVRVGHHRSHACYSRVIR